MVTRFFYQGRGAEEGDTEGPGWREGTTTTGVGFTQA